jgi:hypothetical protein
MKKNCNLCFEPLEGAIARVTFEGFTGATSLNGVTFVVHARCLRLEPMNRGIPLAERLSDPVAEPAEPAA